MMGFDAGRDSQARPGSGDSYKETPPSGAFAPGSNNLGEQDYREPAARAGAGREDVTAPPSGQMQPEDKGGYPVAAHGGPGLGLGLGHAK